MRPIDDSLIDNLIWETIRESPSRGDFICYLIHAPTGAKHREEARERLEQIEETPNNASEYYPQAIAAIFYDCLFCGFVSPVLEIRNTPALVDK